MIQIKEIVNQVFTSKTYILYCEGQDGAWLVDIGDVELVVTFLEEKGLTLEGVFITHAHFDHIYGLPELARCYPLCKVYLTEYAKQGLASDKLNMSRYHGVSVTYEGDLGEFARIATIFPAKAPKYFVTYASDRIKASNRR